MKIVILSGGSSKERKISLISGKCVAESLKTSGHEVIEIDINKEFINILKSDSPKIVFNALHGKIGEDGCIPGLLNILNLKYTHSGVRASSIAMHKPTTKKFLEALKINTPKWKIVKKEEFPFQKKPFETYVIKPVSEGSSIGVQIINKLGKVDLEQINRYDEILVEEYISGKELSVAILNGEALGVVEITTQRQFHDYNSKYINEDTKYTIPANIKKQVYDKAMHISETIYNALDCRGIIRIDFRYNHKLNDGLYVLEVNTHPGLTPASIAPKISEYAGIKYCELIENLIQHAKCDD